MSEAEAVKRFDEAPAEYKRSCEAPAMAALADRAHELGLEHAEKYFSGRLSCAEAPNSAK